MAGKELLLERMTQYDFSGLATNQESGISILAELDVTQWTEGTLEVLVKEAVAG